MTALLTTRDALAGALCKGTPDRQCINYDRDVPGGCSWCEKDADALISSGAVIDTANLADDSDLIDRLYRTCGTEAGLPEILRALAAALSERAR